MISWGCAGTTSGRQKKTAQDNTGQLLLLSDCSRYTEQAAQKAVKTERREMVDFADIYTQEAIQAAKAAADVLRKRIIAELEVENRARLERWPLVWIKGVGPVPVRPTAERSRPD